MLSPAVSVWFYKELLLMLRWRYRLGNGPLLQMLELTTIGSHTGSQSFHQDGDPPSSHGARHVRLAASELSWVHWKQSLWPQNIQIWTHWTIMSGAPCWKSTTNSSWSPGDWWVKSRFADQLGSLRVSAEGSIFKSVSSTQHQKSWKLAFFQSRPHTTGENNVWNAHN